MEIPKDSLKNQFRYIANRYADIYLKTIQLYIRKYKRYISN